MITRNSSPCKHVKTDYSKGSDKSQEKVAEQEEKIEQYKEKDKRNLRKTSNDEQNLPAKISMEINDTESVTSKSEQKISERLQKR